MRLHDGATLDPALDQRLGPRHDLGLGLEDFSVVLSVRVLSPNHINLEEARALNKYVRWILRSQARFCRRIVVLLGSKVVIGAVTKGRSSSKPLNAVLQQLAALCFSGGLILHCVFVPTSHNPSDWPSRGGPATWPTELRRPPSMQKIEERMVNRRLRRVNDELKLERAQLEGRLAHGDDVISTSQAGSIAHNSTQPNSTPDPAV